MPEPLTFKARAHQWSRTAFAIAVLFGSLPLASRIFLGEWGFEGAGEIACLALIAGGYFYFVSRPVAPMPDAATLLEKAGQFAASGRIDRAVALLSRTIRQNPRLWQAFQYRGEMYLRLGNTARALQDFSEAVRLAPDEPNLQALRDHAAREMETQA